MDHTLARFIALSSLALRERGSYLVQHFAEPTDRPKRLQVRRMCKVSIGGVLELVRPVYYPDRTCHRFAEFTRVFAVAISYLPLGYFFASSES